MSCLFRRVSVLPFEHIDDESTMNTEEIKGSFKLQGETFWVCSVKT